MAFIIPLNRDTDGAAHFEQRATLDGVTYALDIRWNERMSAWFMNVYNADGSEALLLGIRLTADYLLAQSIADRSPPGFFMVLDTGSDLGQGEEADFDSLGNRHQLWYVPKDEIR